MSLPEFLTWQLALGIFIAGVIVGWFLSIGVAYRIAVREDKALIRQLLEHEREKRD